MAVNKVEFGDQVVMDITDSTVSPEKLLSGETAYDRSGAKITGSLATKDISIETKRSTGENVATISLDNTDYDIYALSEKEITDLLTGEQTAQGNPISLKTLLGGNAKSCSVDLEPIQDLHGYDSPWVGGAGKNKLNIDGFSDTQRTVVASVNNGVLHLQGTVTAGGNARFALPTTQSIPTGSVTLSVSGSNGNIRVTCQGNNGFTYTSFYGNSSKTFTITDTVTLSYFYVDVTDGTTVNADVKIQIESGSTATAFAPYSNICPISGRTQASVHRCGKNIVNEVHHGNMNSNGTYGTGQTRVTNATSATSSVIKVKAGKYTISAVGLDYATILAKDNYNNIVDNFAGSWHALPYTFTITQTANLYYTARKSDNTTITLANVSVQIEEGEAATTYEPYQGETVTVSFGQTVYGGTLDVTNGKLTIDSLIAILNGTEGWTKYQSTNRYYADGLSFQGLLDTNGDSISNEFTFGGFITSMAGASTEGKYYLQNNVGRVAINSDTFSTASELETYLSTNNLQIVFPLATPIEIILTAEQISLLKGNNVVSTDGDSIILIWQNIPDIEDIKSYVDNAISTNITNVLNNSY